MAPFTNSTPPRLEIAYLSPTLLIGDPSNPRTHSKRQISQLKASIEQFDVVIPVLIDEDNRIISGHAIVQAALSANIQLIPTIKITHLTKSEVRVLSITLNRLAENSSWDKALLGKAFAELKDIELEFDLTITGFDFGEIDFHIDALNNAADDTETDNKVPNAPHSQPITAVGDIWMMGTHRVLCGNSLQADSYAFMNGMSASMSIVDPPYNVPIEGHASGKGRTKHPNFSMACGDMSGEAFTEFLSHSMQRLKSIVLPGAIIFMFMDWRHSWEVLSAARQQGLSHVNTCVWVKNNGGMGSLYRSQHELVHVLKVGRTKHINNVQLGRYGRNRSNVWEYPGVSGGGGKSDEGNLLSLHPTVKPVAMLKDAILDCSRMGDVVFDPFLGVGSTLIASERTGRTCYGIELDPLYVDRAIVRWQNHCGDVARNLRTGQTFNEMAAAVRDQQPGPVK